MRFQQSLYHDSTLRNNVTSLKHKEKEQVGKRYLLEFHYFNENFPLISDKS